MALATTQKRAKAPITWATAEGSVSFFAKTIPAKRKPFLTHCFGRASASSARPSDRCARAGFRSLSGWTGRRRSRGTVSVINEEYALHAGASNGVLGHARLRLTYFGGSHAGSYS